MPRVGLKTQHAVLAALLTVFALGASLALAGAERTSREGLGLILLAGLAASAALSMVLSRYITGPISMLAQYAAEWKPGQPWNCPAPSVSPELDSLFGQVKQLVGHLNEEYQKQRDMNALKSQFVSLVSHELNNAMSVIHAASFSLEELDPEPRNEKRQKMYLMIHRQISSFSTAISNLLNAGRLESGRLALHKKKMEMADVLKSGLGLLELLYEEKRLDVSLALPDTPAAVFADPDALTLVVTNLLSNAIKYTPPGGSIALGIAREGSEKKFVRVYFKDTGIGIRPEDREKIFSGSYRSEASQRAARGFGLGLSLAKSIIEAHGGRLEVESLPGKGSTFSFLLPLWLADYGKKEGGAVAAYPS